MLTEWPVYHKMHSLVRKCSWVTCSQKRRVDTLSGVCQRRSNTSDIIYMNTWSRLPSSSLICCIPPLQQQFLGISSFQSAGLIWVGGDFRLCWSCVFGWDQSPHTVYLACQLSMPEKAAWRSQKHAMLLLTGETLSASRNLNLSWPLPQSVSDCCIGGFKSRNIHQCIMHVTMLDLLWKFMHPSIYTSEKCPFTPLSAASIHCKKMTHICLICSST